MQIFVSGKQGLNSKVTPTTKYANVMTCHVLFYFLLIKKKYCRQYKQSASGYVMVSNLD